MQIELELLAPAKNKDIGIAAIDCGADAVYIAGPKFGARESAGNSFSDIAELASYAHKFGAKVYMVVNTILYDNELEEARKSICRAYEIGCDAVIVQDLSVLKMDLPPIPLFASTQTNIRTTEQAKFLESLGFQRLILARELSLEQISDIKKKRKCRYRDICTWSPMRELQRTVLSEPEAHRQKCQPWSMCPSLPLPIYTH